MSVFAPSKPEKIVAHQLYEAKRLLLEHQAAAEYHGAMVAMYGQRVNRLAKPVPDTTPCSTCASFDGKRCGAAEQFHDFSCHTPD